MEAKHGIIVFVLAIWSLGTFVSCKHSAETVLPDREMENFSKPLPENWQHTLKGYDLCENLSGKIQIRYNDIVASGQIRVKKDKTIWISVSVLGLEAGRIMLTQDSIHFMNRWQREYFMADYNRLSATLEIPLSYDLVQSVLLGTDLKEEKAKNKSMNRTGSFVEIHYQQREIKAKAPLIDQKLYVSKENFRLVENHMEIPNTTRRLHVTYDQWRYLKPQIPFPMHLHVVLHLPDETNIDVVFKNIDRVETLSFPFQIPKNYTQRR